MKRASFVAVALLLSMQALPASAQEANCETPQDQTSMNVCAQQSYEKADAALNDTYSRLLAKAGADGAERLREAQRAWIAYRDAQCAFDTLGSVGGTIHPMAEAQCLEGLTSAQTQHLADQLDCEEGDLSCGGQ